MNVHVARRRAIRMHIGCTRICGGVMESRSGRCCNAAAQRRAIRMHIACARAARYTTGSRSDRCCNAAAQRRAIRMHIVCARGPMVCVSESRSGRCCNAGALYDGRGCHGAHTCTNLTGAPSRRAGFGLPSSSSGSFRTVGRLGYASWC